MTKHKTPGQEYYERRLTAAGAALLPLWQELSELERMHYEDAAYREYLAKSKKGERK